MALLRCTCWHGMAWRKEALGMAPLPLETTAVPLSAAVQGAPDAGAVCHAGGS